MNTPKKQRRILTYPNPYLREVARPVTEFNDELRSLFEDMRVLMHHSDGVGLAATQVGEPVQLLVLSDYVFLPEAQREKIIEEDGDMGEDIAVINPQVIEESEVLVVGNEGCLSFPDVYIKVKRPTWVKISAQDLNGEQIELRGEGLGARAILHEMDHLTGKVMTDHLSFLARQKALKDHQKIQRLRADELTEETGEVEESPSKTGSTPSKTGSSHSQKRGTVKGKSSAKKGNKTKRKKRK